MFDFSTFRIYFFLFTVFVFPQRSKVSEKEMDILYLRFEKNIASPRKSEPFAKSYLQKAKILKNDYHLITGYSMILSSSDLKTGEKYLDTMMQVATRYKKDMVIYTFLRKGQFYCHHRKLKEALGNYLIAYKESANQNNHYLNHIKYEIAIVKAIMGKYEDALITFHQMEKELEQTDEKEQYTQVIFSISNAYFHLGKITEAIEYTNKGLKLTKENNNIDLYQYFISNRGKNNFKKNNFKKAIIDLSTSLPTIKNTEDFANYSENCYYLGESYRKLYNKEKSIYFFKKIDSVFNNSKYIFPDIVHSYKYLIQDAKRKKDINKAIYYTNQLLKADSVVKQNYDYIIDTAHKEYDLPELVADKEILIKELEANSKNSIILYTIITLILILIFLYFYNRKKREIQKQKKLLHQFVTENNFNIKGNKKSNDIEIDNEKIEGILIKLNKFEQDLEFKNEVTLDSLAKDFETNTSYLSMIINKKKGLSFPNYINNLRIELALDLLQKDKKYRNYSIKGLAIEVGFSSSQTFSRAFLSKTGVNASFFINELKTKDL
ncbi:hypothetical protein BWK59_10950 [Flavobacterium davisii]|uniref:HTH araC/xylS-type domain-containing protein n=1 Tax=Flavobacterium davisii TaxID=2906077 RepID=A0A246GGV0_9FLAO|nr:helix-turn-helix domain-containing protein [Flavobacterium davisii]OWP83357.1 hypothetical protein BWK59_10950 [Flavobacterium davisii]